MVKLFSCFLTVLILSQSIGAYFGSLEEFNVLLEHAKVHSEEYGDDFIVFLSKHYGNLKEQHSHDEPERENQHENLPFNHNGSIHSPITLNEAALAISPVWHEPSGESVSGFGYTDLYTSLFISGILQPPQHA
jgi:hypothetical protein